MKIRSLVAIVTMWLAGSGAMAIGPGVQDAAPNSSGPPPRLQPLVLNPDLGIDSAAEGINPLAVLDSAGRAVSGAKGDDSKAGGLSTAINIMIVLTVLSLAPSIVLMTTCFMRILIVLGVLKQAIGASNVPPPQVITATALFTTFVVMSPTLDRINAEAVVPYRTGEIKNYDELWLRARQPMRDFMFDQIDACGNWSSVYMILSRRGVDVSEPEKLTRDKVDMITLVPAYMLSELKTSFLLAFKVYLPFLVIDMVVSTMLISMGMMMLPPVMVSLPFKILLFVLVDGWTLVVSGLMRSFAQHGDLQVSLAGASNAVLALFASGSGPLA
jgi:flagellar biosynthetic protein FliP